MKKLIQLFIFLLPFGLIAQKHIEEYNKGVVAQNSRDYYKAIIHYDKCLKIDNKYIPAYLGRASVHASSNQQDKAIEDCTKAIKIDPNSRRAYQIRGLAHKTKKDYKAAIVDFTKEIELSKDTENKARAYYNRAWAYDKLLDDKAKLADFKKAVELVPHHVDYQYDCGRAKFDNGGIEYESAVKNFTKVIELDPKHLEAYTERATYYMTFQDFAQALKDLKIAKEMGAEVDHLIDAASFELEMLEEEGNH